MKKTKFYETPECEVLEFVFKEECILMGSRSGAMEDMDLSDDEYNI